MITIESILSKTFKDLPKEYFKGKTALNYSFFIQDDIAKAGGDLPTLYNNIKHHDYIVNLYKDIKDVALYIQIPWCEFRCTYCYYFKNLKEDHGTEAIEKLIRAEQKHALLLDEEISLNNKTINSIYFGGGTPTILDDNLLEEHLAFFSEKYCNQNTEFCVETTLNTLTPTKLNILQKYVTRLSIGIQSFKNHLLKKVERRFTADEAENLLRDIVPKFPSVNIDLIYGLQTQTMDDWLDSVKTAIDLQVPSVTAYRLELRHGVPLAKAFENNPQEFPDELLSQAMYLLAKEMFFKAGYRENLVGWFLSPKVKDTVVYRERWEKQTPCVAFGPDVHNYGENHFYDNISEHDNYINTIENGKLPIKHFYSMTTKKRVMWYAVSQWKSNSPVYKSVIASRYGTDDLQWFLDLISDFIDWKTLALVNDKISLTDSGAAIIEWMLRDIYTKGFGEYIYKKSFEDGNKSDSLKAAILNEDIHRVEELIREGVDLNEMDKNGVTVLHLAAWRGYEEIVLLLIKRGVDVNAKAIGGVTPLHLATLKGRINVIEIIIKNGGEVDAKDDDGRTPLYIAAGQGNKRAIDVLIKSGADIKIKNKKGLTPVNYLILSNLY